VQTTDLLRLSADEPTPLADKSRRTTPATDPRAAATRQTSAAAVAPEPTPAPLAELTALLPTRSGDVTKVCWNRENVQTFTRTKKVKCWGESERDERHAST
jgi:hypothetical protein